MGIDLEKNEVAFRMNLVTLDRRSEKEIVMVSHSSGDISTEEGKAIIESLKKGLTLPGISIYPGIAYRHLLVWEQGPERAKTIPPHDVLDQNMVSYLNHGADDPVVGIIRLSWDCLEDHPVNINRRKRGLNEANSVWLWGQGRALDIPLFNDKFGLQGGVISAVDLLRGDRVSTQA